jgi:hypothetical protein
MRGRSHEHGHRLGRREAVQPGPVVAGQRPAATVPAAGVHGDAGQAKRVQVPLDGPRRHLQAAGQLTRGQGLVRLHQEQDPEQPLGTHPSNMTDPGYFGLYPCAMASTEELLETHDRQRADAQQGRQLYLPPVRRTAGATALTLPVPHRQAVACRRSCGYSAERGTGAPGDIALFEDDRRRMAARRGN